MKKIIYLLLFVFAFFIRCSDDNKDVPLTGIQFSENRIKINYGEEINLSVFPDPIKAEMPEVFFTTENIFIASVSNQGVVKGQKAGDTTIKVTTKDHKFSSKCKIIVKPTDYFVEEPCLNFGSVAADIKSNERRVLIHEDDGSLIYAGDNEYVYAVFYFFEKDELSRRYIMTNAAIRFNVWDDTAQRLDKFIEQRYILTEKKNGFHYFMQPNSRLRLGMRKDSQFIDVSYQYR